jgi:hypothetical protein
VTGYLTDLADVLRRAGLAVVEYPDWQSRANKSGGYGEGRPWGVMWHHDAASEGASDQARADYEAVNSPEAPVANLHVMRSGEVWVLAAGRTNTNGKGAGVTWSKGAVPTDSMNSYAVGMELSNTGVGQTYPQAQIDAAIAASNAVNAAYGNLPIDVATHYQWAPNRKIDPAQAAAVEGPWQPRGITGSGTWSDDDLRSECRVRAATPAPPSGDDDMLLYVEVNDAWARFIGTGQINPLVLWQVGYTSGSRADVHRANLPHVEVTKAQLTGCTLVGAPPPADDGGGPARWDATADFYEHVHSNRG